jgi:hypothetical protein
LRGGKRRGMRTVAGVDVVPRGSSHVLVTLTDEGGRKHTFELTRPLAAHLQWLLSVRQPLADEQLLTPEELAERAGRGSEDRASE